MLKYIYLLIGLALALETFNKQRSLSHVLRCDKTQRVFENTNEMKTTQVSVFYISRVFSNVRNVLSQRNIWLIGFSTNQSALTVVYIL